MKLQNKIFSILHKIYYHLFFVPNIAVFFYIQNDNENYFNEENEI